MKHKPRYGALPVAIWARPLHRRRARVAQHGPPAVLLLYPLEGRGGSRTMVETLKGDLRRHGISTYFGATEPGRITLEGCDRTWNLHRSRGPLRLLVDGWKLARFVRAHHIVVIHAHLNSYFLAAVAGFLSGCPSVRTLHGRLSRPGMLSLGAVIPALAALHLFRQHIVAVTPDIAAEVARHYPLAGGKRLHVVTNGISLPPRPDARVSERSSMLTFMYVGGINELKGCDTLFTAWRTVEAAGRPAQLVVLGQGELTETMSTLIRERRTIATAVGWMGRDEVLDRLSRDCDVFVLPSRSEGLSIALLEAMSLAKPVIISEAANQLGVVTHGQEGLVFRTGSVEGLASALMWMLENRGRIHSMGIAARERVVAAFSQGACTRAYVELYEKLAGTYLGSGRISE